MPLGNCNGQPKIQTIISCANLTVATTGQTAVVRNSAVVVKKKCFPVFFLSGFRNIPATICTRNVRAMK